MAVRNAQAEGRLSEIKPEDSQRYSYVELKPAEQFTLDFEPRFQATETTARVEKAKGPPKPEVPFESLAPRMQVIAALKNTPPEYLERAIDTRTALHRVGSYFEVTAAQLKSELFKAKWEPYNPLDTDGNPIISGGARGYRTTIAGGRLGMISTDTIADTANLYLIDPKGTGKWSLSTVGAAEPHTGMVTMIVAEEPSVGKNIVFTFHPGEPVRSSNLDTSTLSTLMASSGLKTDGSPDAGTGRRIPITRAQLDQLNARLPEHFRLTLAKIESEENIKPGD